MTAEIHIDAHDLEQLRRAIEGLPGEIKTKAMRRVMGRLSGMARTRLLRRSAEHTKMPRAAIKDTITAHFNAGGNTVEAVVKSGWIRLRDLEHQKTSTGVSVPLRGSYNHAFMATMSNGHYGVFRRVWPEEKNRKGRAKIREMFTANPANAITNDPDEYLDVLAELIEQYVMPRTLHEIGRLLPK